MSTSPTVSPDDRKLVELILYIAKKSERDATFGKVKLSRLLFLADFTAYKKLGRPITGQEYQRLDDSPSPRRFDALSKEMKSKDELAFQTHEFRATKQLRPIALRDADLSAFDGREIALVDEIIESCWGKSASQGFSGWKLAEIGETIPYPIALVSQRPLTAAEEARALGLQDAAAKCLNRDAPVS